MAGTVDVEQDGFFLKHVLDDTDYPEIATIIKRAFDTVIPRKAIDFRTNVGRVIQQCLSMHGVPMFRTKYAGEPFGAGLPGGAFVLMVCYGSHNGKLKGVWFKGVPPEDLDLLAAKKDGYMLMLRKYGQMQAYPTMPRYPQEAVTLGGAAAYTGQAIVSEPINELRYAIDGNYVPYEEFEKTWKGAFPITPVPSKPGYFTGRTHTFTIVTAREVTALEASLKSIETMLQDALADEEKAVPFYETLLNGIKGIRGLIPKEDVNMDATLFAALKDIEGIMADEKTHRQKIMNRLFDIEQIRKRVVLKETAKAAQRILV